MRQTRERGGQPVDRIVVRRPGTVSALVCGLDAKCQVVLLAGLNRHIKLPALLHTSLAAIGIDDELRIDEVAMRRQ